MYLNRETHLRTRRLCRNHLCSGYTVSADDDFAGLSIRPENTDLHLVKFNSTIHCFRLVENTEAPLLLQERQCCQQTFRQSMPVDEQPVSDGAAKENGQVPVLNLAADSVVAPQAEKTVVLLMVSDKPTPAAGLNDPVPQMQHPKGGQSHS